ncbi:hypothetical protein D3C84_1318400 [compost metagenome]
MALQITGRRAQHPSIAHQPPADVLAGDVIADTDLQVEPFADDVHHPIKQVEANLQVRVTFGQQ